MAEEIEVDDIETEDYDIIYRSIIDNREFTSKNELDLHLKKVKEIIRHKRILYNCIQKNIPPLTNNVELTDILYDNRYEFIRSLQGHASAKGYKAEPGTFVDRFSKIAANIRPPRKRNRAKRGE